MTAAARTSSVKMLKILKHLTWQLLGILVIAQITTGRTDFTEWNPPKHKIQHSRHYESPKPKSILNKVTLTQKGYIQFLRYIADAPVITEFTFCIWLKSSNLTYAHPLLSYSLHEEQRFIRAWISPHGKEINLAILENEVFKIPTYFRDHVWYHICQSWDSAKGSWSFFLNGKLKASGHAHKMKGLKIPKGGDVVVGQEYTDFDKGLDDGIEGDIFGFNLVLASTTTSPEVSFDVPYDLSQRRIFTPNSRNKPYSNTFGKHPQQSAQAKDNYDYYMERHPGAKPTEEVPSVLSYFTVGANRLPRSRSIFDMGQNLVLNFLDWIQQKKRVRLRTIDEINVNGNKKVFYVLEPPVAQPAIISPQRANRRIINGNSRIVNDIDDVNQTPLGLQLVELSYNCALGKGAPINHEKVLVSWTKTPVRVFGGAILKNVPPFCYKR